MSLGFSVLGLGLALTPRTLSGDYAFPHIPQHSASGSPLHARGSVLRLTMWPRLLRFPLFWIGLALLTYIALQGFNPSWVWTRNATTWWLVRVNDIEWLPTSIETPFARFNLWRQFIIYASAWLTVCTLWVGFTRRRSLQILLTVLCVNAVVLAIVGFVHRLLSPNSFFGQFDWPKGASAFASFIYKNHAGAYLALMASLAVALALWTHDEGVRRGKKSTPASLLVFGALLLAAGVLSSHSRGATLTAAGFLALTGIWLIVRSRRQPAQQDRNSTITALVALAFALTLLGSARYLDFSEIADRFSALSKDPGSTLEARWKVAEAGQAMLVAHGWRGIGAGGFRYLFPEYIKRYPEIHEGGKLFWDHVHRDWLEIPIELGAAGTLLLILGGGYGLFFFFRSGPRVPQSAGVTGNFQRTTTQVSGLRSQPSVIWHSLTIPLLLGCAQTLGHAWFDFPFQNPAILITWLALVAIAARWVESDATRG